MNENYQQLEKATLGGGCFWCLEAVFEQLEGVHAVTSGYAGGDAPHPSYQAVCSGSTGHAEVVQIAYDPEVIAFEELLDVFFDIHDPTTLNRQGADVGTQYRSAIFYPTEEQRETAEQKIEQLDASGRWPAPMVTEVTALETFYPAEDYHQEYYRQHQRQPYCQMVIAPKVSKLHQHYESKLKPEMAGG